MSYHETDRWKWAGGSTAGRRYLLSGCWRSRHSGEEAESEEEGLRSREDHQVSSEAQGKGCLIEDVLET